MITSSRMLSSPHGSESTEASTSTRWTLMKHERSLVKLPTFRPDHCGAYCTVSHHGFGGPCMLSHSWPLLHPSILQETPQLLTHSYAKRPRLDLMHSLHISSCKTLTCMVDLIYVQQQHETAYCPVSKHCMSLVLPSAYMHQHVIHSSSMPCPVPILHLCGA